MGLPGKVPGRGQSSEGRVCLADSRSSKEATWRRRETQAVKAIRTSALGTHWGVLSRECHDPNGVVNGLLCLR